MSICYLIHKVPSDRTGKTVTNMQERKKKHLRICVLRKVFNTLRVHCFNKRFKDSIYLFVIGLSAKYILWLFRFFFQLGQIFDWEFSLRNWFDTEILYPFKDNQTEFSPLPNSPTHFLWRFRVTSRTLCSSDICLSEYRLHLIGQQ